MATAAEPKCEFDSESDKYNKEDYIICPVCLDYFNNPKLLPCGHVTCSQCLINWMKAEDMPLTCPLCRGTLIAMEVTSLPPNATPEEISAVLPNELSIACLVETHKMLKGPHVCGKCGEEASSLCLDCCRKLCKDCRRKHAKATGKRASKAAAKREAALAAEASGASSSNSNIPYVAPKKHRIELLAQLDPRTIFSNRGELCSKHPAGDYSVDYYCVTHEEYLCLKCIEGGHSDCSLTTAKERTDEMRKSLRKYIDMLKEREEEITQEADNLTQHTQKVEAACQEFHTDIDSIMDGIMQRLHERKERLRVQLLETENLPTEERTGTQESLLSTFRDDLSNIMSLERAESAVERFSNVRHEAMAATRKAGSRGLGNHHVRQQRANHVQQLPQPSLDSELLAVRELARDLNNTIQQVTTRLDQTVLSNARDSTEANPDARRESQNPDDN